MVTASDVGQVLFGRTRSSILALTYLRPDESFYVREIIRRTGCGTGGVQRELRLLLGCGLLRKEKERFYQANARSPLFEPLKQLVVRTVGLGAELAAALGPCRDAIRCAFVFGSFARGEHAQHSDVDVMIIARNKQLTVDHLWPLVKPLQQTLGREISLFVLPDAEWRSKARSGNAFVTQLLRSSKMFLIGDANELNDLVAKSLAQTTPTHTARHPRPVGSRKSRPRRRIDAGAR